MAFMPVVWLDLFFSGCNDWRSNVAAVVLFSAGLLPRCEPTGSGRICGRAGRLSNLIEATTMSHTCATKKSIAPFRQHSDLLKRGGVYEETDGIAWILPGKLGNGKNAGG
jgi:hypothetical protein